MASKKLVDHLGVAFGRLDNLLQEVDLDNSEETIAAGTLVLQSFFRIEQALFASAKLGLPGHKLLLKEGEESTRRSFEAAQDDFARLCACVTSKECQRALRGIHKSRRR